MNDRQLRMIKKAFMPLTDQAMAAQGTPMPPQGGMPMPPPGAAPMPPQGGMPPVDPATVMPIDPNTGMPIDPNMMAQGAPMPPVDPNTGMPVDPATGMPVDPNTGMPMDPNMMAQGAPMPPQGGAQVSTGDMVIDALLGMGVMIVDPNGQPIPPEMIAQMVQEMNAQTGGMPQEGSSTGDTNGDAVLETMAQLDKNISVLLDKVDSIRNLIDSDRGADESYKKSKDNSAEADVNAIDAELQAMLEEQAIAGQQNAPMEMPVDAMPMAGMIDPQQAEQLSLMQAMQRG